VITDNATAAALVAIKPGVTRSAAPISGINRVRKGGSIIVTESVSTGADRLRPA
jgi:hypothetical protein